MHLLGRESKSLRLLLCTRIVERTTLHLSHVMPMWIGMAVIITFSALPAPKSKMTP